MNPEPQVEPLDIPAPASTSYRGKGKIAHLSKSLRDQINAWLLDGLPYADIIQRLGEDGKGIKPSHLGEWKKRGYQTWLLEQRWVEETRTRQEVSSDLVRDNDPTDLHQAALQIGTLHIFDALRSLGPDGLGARLGGDAAAYARLINALARATRETLMLQKYRRACADARALLLPLKDPHRQFNESEHRAVVGKIDEILGLRSLAPEPSSFNRPEMPNPEISNRSEISDSAIPNSEISNP